MNNNQKLEGYIVGEKDRLQRKIKVIMVKKQNFTPAWASTEIYGNMDDGGARYYNVLLFRKIVRQSSFRSGYCLQ